MNVKHGFSTLNRLLGKKNKGHHLSKSTTNLNSISSHNNQIDTSSLSSHHNNHNHQLEQNRITPLPIATTNAPFEQTFRITVLLPKGQLYVARLGAKTKLQKLLEIVCENKQLDQERYEFRHPVDSSQVFSCELTIGAVGLNEIRLCHKSEAYDNFNADEIIKLRHTGRDSLSSSEFSSRNSKHTLKTASPYSSTNSLNSIDSTGMSTNYRGQIVSLPPSSVPNTMRSFVPKPPPVAPARKKRIAPRPPSQNSIPEKEPINGNDENNSNKSEHSIYKKEFHVSSPNLMSQSIEFTSLRSKDFHKSNLSVDCNGNTSNRENNNTTNIIVKVNKEKNIPNGNLSNGHLSFPRNDIQSSSNSNEKETKNIKARPVSMSAIGDEIIKNEVDNGFDFTRNQILEEKNDRRSSTSTMNGSTETLKVPEPTPRKKIITNKKKAPAPPPRVLQCPIALPRNATETTEISTIKSKENIVDTEKPKSNGILPQGVHQNEMESTKASKWNDIESKENAKVLLQNNVENEIRHHINGNAVDQSPNLQNDIQISSSENSIESSQSYLKPTFESSSDEEEHIKVYNLKLGKTIVKPLVEHKTYEDLTAISSLNDESTHTEDVKIQEMHSTRSESPEWSYTIPAPPNFADDNSTKAHLPKTSSSNISDSSIPLPITEVKIDQKQETVLENLSKIESATEIITSDIEDGYRGGNDQIECQENESIIQNKNLEKDSNDDSLKFDENINSSRSDVMVELNNILNENRLEEVISRSVDDREKIESSKPSSLSNFKISTYSTNVESEKENEYDSVQDNQTRKNSDTEEKSKNSSLKEDDIRESQEQNISHENHEKYFVEDIKESSLNEKNSITSVLKLEKEESCILKNETTFLHESDSVNQYQTEEKISMQYENNNEGNANTDKQPESSQKIKNDISSHIEDERLFKKRSNVNSNCTTPHIFKSRISITRSDSFHSTQHPNNMSTDNSGGISVRSSSYISLFNAQIAEQNKTNLNQPFKDTRHRKSSSELSIGESPSLQSLIVMKSILNSRKNSFNTEEDAQNRLTSNKIHNENSFRQETKLLYNDCDSSKENSPKNKILSQEEKIVERVDRQEEPEKKWKYQGPPSINLTSWNERPKIQVSIKNDGDYKFGVGGGGIGGNTSITTFPRVYRNAVATNSTQHQQQKIDTSPVRIVNEQPKVPFVRGVEYKKPLTSTSIDVSKSIGESNSIVYIKPLDSDATINSTMSNTMTLGRMPKINRNANFVPTVRGFRNSTPVTVENGFYSLKTDSIHETSNKSSENEKYMDSQNSLSQQKFNLQTWKNSSNNLGRSNSIVSTYPSKYSTPSPYINQNNQNNINGTFSNKNSEENPFSKVVLRKTGLKEKIMPTSNKLETPPKPIKMNNSNCAKLELKLTTTVSHNSKPTPPPLPPVIRSVITKQNANNNQDYGIGNSRKLENGDCIQEPRDVLLSAIRNFNRETLKRS